VTALALVGAALGAVLFAVVWRLSPPTPSPLVQLGRFDARYRNPTPSPGGVHPDAGAEGRRAETWLGRWAAAELGRRGITYTTLRQDLALTGRSFEAVMGRKVVAAVAGFVLALAALAGLQLTGGVALPPGAPVVVAALVAAGFFFLPDLEARGQAHRRRRDFRRALGSYLDLVALEMAGSAAPAEALPNAARVGAGWPLALLRDTLFRATRSGRDPWTALTELGERIAVPELRDLGMLVRLVAHDGARVRQTLTARAATIRRRELAEAEGTAGERDESMRMAQVLIGFGFVVFIGYPAVVNVLNF
jgi:Flp pilus assembly protein TadB